MNIEEKIELINYVINPDNNPDNDRFAYNRIINYYEEQCKKNSTILSFPNRILWKITGACNCKCEHCWANLGHATDRDKLLKLAKELSDNHAAMVSLSGGEPLLCKDLFDIYRILKTNNAIVEILTNGSLVTEEWIKQYKTVATPETDVIQISLDGPNSAIHDLQRNRSIFDKVIEAIKLLKKAGVKVRISFTATRLNQDYIHETFLLAQSLNVNVMSITPVFPLRNGKKQELFLDEEVYLEQLLKCFRSKKTTEIRAQVPFGFQEMAMEVIKTKKDAIIIPELGKKMFMQETNMSMQIDAFGQAIPGPEYEDVHVSGNVYEEGIKAVWDRGTNWQEFRSFRDLTNTSCAKCEIYGICGGGNAKTAYDKYGTINAPDGRCCV